MSDESQQIANLLSPKGVIGGFISVATGAGLWARQVSKVNQTAKKLDELASKVDDQQEEITDLKESRALDRLEHRHLNQRMDNQDTVLERIDRNTSR